ncbi:phosphatase [Hymenobacter defluvii]|uniref:Phosphatase n=1 Tax=Hymenobacter defluvii TaxID=2054411 RepID=A0ABS3T6Q9_9BACT|nr:phosphatase [Hymenobacter defluvii]MBO3269332.1 phosphatase [Hymenobacter defluvii]
MEYPLLKLAAIDIGSNAVRCQISAVLLYEGQFRLKRVEYVRYPMRLGEDVFATGQISAPKEEKFVKFLHSLKLLMEVHDVAHHLICATSAMRTATNAPGIVERVRKELGLEIQVIDGQAEAAYINRVMEHLLEDKKHYLHIDVGGGSTEFNIYHDRHKVASQSFEVGSIRRMQQAEQGADGAALESTWDRMEAWVRENARRYHVTRAIGTGGNIGKIYNMIKPAAGTPITRKTIAATLRGLEAMTMDQRVNVAMLNPDRADVILPAGNIYLSAMEWANINTMQVPDIGLKDGMMQTLFEDHFEEMRPASYHTGRMPFPNLQSNPTTE